MNTDTKEHGIVVRYNQYNVALVTLEDYKKLLKERDDLKTRVKQLEISLDIIKALIEE